MRTCGRGRGAAKAGNRGSSTGSSAQVGSGPILRPGAKCFDCQDFSPCKRAHGTVLLAGQRVRKVLAQADLQWESGNRNHSQVLLWEGGAAVQAQHGDGEWIAGDGVEGKQPAFEQRVHQGQPWGCRQMLTSPSLAVRSRVSSTLEACRALTGVRAAVHVSFVRQSLCPALADGDASQRAVGSRRPRTALLPCTTANSGPSHHPVVGPHLDVKVHDPLAVKVPAWTQAGGRRRERVGMQAHRAQDFWPGSGRAWQGMWSSRQPYHQSVKHKSASQQQDLRKGGCDVQGNALAAPIPAEKARRQGEWTQDWKDAMQKRQRVA